MSETLQVNNKDNERLQEIEAKFSSLNESAQAGAVMLASGTTGFGKKFISGMEVSDEDFREILESGLLRVTTRQEVAQEYVDANREYIEGLRSRPLEDYFFTSEEKLPMDRFDNEVRVANDGQTTTWFEYPQDVFDYLQRYFSEEEIEE